MCLILKSKDKELFIASEPITVFKVLALDGEVYHWHGEYEFTSPYHPSLGPLWTRGEGYDTLLGQARQCPIPQSRDRAVSFAYGPMSAISAAMTVEIGYRIDEGFHSYGNTDSAHERAEHLYWEQNRSRRKTRDFRVLEMTIPLAARYYHNTEKDEYASDRIYFNHEDRSKTT